MRIVELQEFLALKGSILFREVVVEKTVDGHRWVPKEFSDPLMVRAGDSIQGSYYESAIASHSLSDLFLYSRDNHFAAVEKELDLTPIRGDNQNKYFLIYEKEDVISIIKLLTETL